MTYLVFMNYIMLAAICGHMMIIASDRCWLILDIIGVIAMLVHLSLKEIKKEQEEMKNE